MPIIPTFGAALSVLKTQLTVLQSDTDLRIDARQEAPFVDIVTLSSQPTPQERVGRAAFLLSGTEEKAPEWGFYARRATIICSCRASAFAGGLESEAEGATRAPLPEIMADKLEAFIESAYPAIRDAGLLNPTARRTGQGIADTDVHFTDVQITFIFLTQDG